MRCVVVLGWVLVLVLAGQARAERLPVHVFTTADGLANNRVERGTQDTKGFIWFATGEGVSRFDSRRFESFGLSDGLPGSRCNDILATRDGRVWVATEAGLAVLDPDVPMVRPRFRVVSSDESFRIAEDPSGVLWVGTPKGLTRIERGAITEVAIPAGVLGIAYDDLDRSLWLGTFSGLVHRSATGELTHYRISPPDEPDDRTFAIMLARDRTLWVGHVSARVLRMKLPLAATTEPLSISHAGDVLVPDSGARRNILQDSTGTIWVASSWHVHRWNGTRLEVVSADQIGSEGAPSPSLEDSAGNLWFGTDAQGVVRLSRGGMVTYDMRDGLTTIGVIGWIKRQGGALYTVITNNGYDLARRDGEHLTSVRPKWPAGVTLGAWTYGQVSVIDRDGRLWYPTGNGVLRFPPVARLEDYATIDPERITDLPGRDISRIYEDRRGDIWIGTMSKLGLARWDRATDTIVTLTDEWAKDLTTGFAEDARGDLWVSQLGHLVRIHEGVATVAPAPIPDLDAVHIDRAGRMWLASGTQGVARIDDPLHPIVRRYREAQIGSLQALSFVEDLQGRIYVGTSRGIARIDPATDEIVRYGLADGLPNDYVWASERDVDGTLWFGTKGGMARLTPEAPRPPVTASLYIQRLAIAGTPQALVPGGVQHIGPLELASDETALDVDLACPQLSIGGGVRFQYRLDDTWSEPADEQVLHFARLAAGHYDLEIRAIDARNAVSASATIDFRVLPPIWRRTWFAALTALVIAGLAYAAYRRRLAHLLALERVRRRIATDLHDELGSSLSRISILSEVARASTDKAPDKLEGQLEVIGTSARELVDVASDIVWATDPRRDDLGSLIVRLRSFAADVLEARGIAWAVRAPADPDRIKLDPERRRHLYLVLKEAISNAARHSGATEVDVEISVERGEVIATVRDNGRGFTEATLPGTGNGLGNMRSRAEEAGGHLEIRADAGTKVVLRL